MIDSYLIQNAALNACNQASIILRERFGKAHTIEKKGKIDLVTEADLASEKAILGVLKRAFPTHGFIAEESGEKGSPEEFTWIIDPLDGTTNFAHDLPLFSVSIAFAAKGETLFGLVANPVTNELFIGEKGKGAYLNSKKIHVSNIKTLDNSLLVTGFPYNLREKSGPLLKRFESCLCSAQGIRRLGSAALDLCFVACGRFEAFWEEGLKPWDTAAGALILQEAGGKINGFDNSPWNPYNKNMIASNGLIHQEMLALLK